MSGVVSCLHGEVEKQLVLKEPSHAVGKASGIPVQCSWIWSPVANLPHQGAAGNVPNRIRLERWLLPYFNGPLSSDTLLPHHCGSFFHMALKTVCIPPPRDSIFLMVQDSDFSILDFVRFLGALPGRRGSLIDYNLKIKVF